MRCWPVLLLCVHCLHVALVIPVEPCPVDGAIARDCTGEKLVCLRRFVHLRTIRSPACCSRSSIRMLVMLSKAMSSPGVTDVEGMPLGMQVADHLKSPAQSYDQLYLHC